MNEKGRQTKLLAAVAILAMVVCAFAASMPSIDAIENGYTETSANVTPINGEKEIGTAADLLSLAGNDSTYGNRIVVAAEGATLVLTGNITEPVNVSFILNGDLTIKSKGTTTYSLNIASNAIAAYSTLNSYNVVVYANAADKTLTIDNANVTIASTADRTYVNTVINNQYEAVNFTIDVKNKSTLTIDQTGSAEVSGTAWMTGNAAIGTLKVNDSEVELNSIGSLQAIVVDAQNNSKIYANMSGTATFTTYLGLNNSSLEGNNIGIYGAKINGSSIKATTVLGIYAGGTGTVNNYELSKIVMEGTSTVEAVKIINGLSASTGVGNNTITFTGTGSITGELTGVNAGNIGNYKFTGINADRVTLGTNAKIDSNSTYAEGSVGATAEVTPVAGSSTITNTDVTTAFSNGAAKVEVASGTITGTISGISGQLVLGDDVTFESKTEEPLPTLTLTTTGSIIKNFRGDSLIINGSDSSSVKFLNANGNISIYDGSVVIDGAEGIDDTTVEITGNVKIYGEINGQLKLTNRSGTLTIMDESNQYSTLTISEGAELILDGFDSWRNEAGGILDIQGTLTSTGTSSTPFNFTNSAKIITYPTTNLNNVTLGGNVEYKTSNIAYEFKGMLDQDFTVSTEQSLTGDLWIPDGVTLTVSAGGVLNLAGYGIYVQGTLDVQAGGAVKSIGVPAVASVFDGKILLHRDGVINNEGIIGSGSQVTVSADIRTKNIADTTDETAYGGLFANTDLRVNYIGVGSVTMQNIEGVSFGIVNSNGTRYLTITGDVNTYGTDAPYTVSATGVRIIGEFTIGDDVRFTVNANPGVTVLSEATVNIDGILNVATPGTFVMENKSTVNVEGQVIGVITAYTGKAPSAGFAAPGTTTVQFGNNANSDYVIGTVLTVGQITYVEDNVSKTEQILYISGNVEVVNGDGDADNDTATLQITNNNGISHIAEGDVLDIEKEVAVAGGNTIVEGQVVYVAENSARSISGFLGTQYIIEGAVGADDVGYITTFEAAYAQIANAKSTKITVIGDMTIEIDVNLAAKQTIVVSNYNVDIDADATVEVQKGGVITGKINDVQGVLISYSGAGVTVPQSYAVYKKTTEYVQWSGLIPAINNAVAGDVIDVRNDATVKDDMTIPAGVTVNNKAVLIFEKDLVIAETAVLNNDGGTIQMVGEKSTITVNGTLDSSEGTVNFMNANIGADSETNPYIAATSKGADDSRSMTSVGNTIIGNNGGNINLFISAAYFQNDDGYREYTTVAKAVSAAEAMDTSVTAVNVTGTLNQSEDVTLAAGTTLTIDTGSKVTLGKVILTAGVNGTTGSKVISNGQLTATVAGATGVVGSTSESTVELSKAALTIEMVSNTDNQNVTSDYLVISGNASGTPVTYAGVSGAVTVSTGTVNAGTIEFDGKGNTLTVAEGATLAVQSIGTIDADLDVGNNESKAAVTVRGTIILSDGGELSMETNSVMDVIGTMTVGDDMDVSIVGTLNVTGTLAVSTTEDKEAKVTVAANGVLAVEGTVTGAVDTALAQSGTNGYIKAYAGADLTDAIIDMIAGAEEPTSSATAFYVNGDLYMTIYAQSGLTFSQVMGTYQTPVEKFDLAGFVIYIPGTNSPVLNIYRLSDWYTDAELTDEADNETLANNEALYFKAPAATADVVISVGSGISLYIDDVRYDSGRTVTLSVGTHTVTATVNPGYKGDVTVQFNGQTVTNGQFEITADMASAAYDGILAISATGNITQDSTVVVDGGSEDGLGLTDYLLIVLVVLIVVMAIMVALRLMRS